MTQETPVKVFSLLGAAMFSMFLLFGVSVSNASFAQMENPLPDVFNPSSVVAVLDSVSYAYSSFVNENLVMPVKQDYALFQYNLDYVIDEAGPSILAITGLESLADVESISEPAPQVAGAFTKKPYYGYRTIGESFSVDTLYALLIR